MLMHAPLYLQIPVVKWWRTLYVLLSTEVIPADTQCSSNAQTGSWYLVLRQQPGAVAFCKKTCRPIPLTYIDDVNKYSAMLPEGCVTAEPYQFLSM
jgi:hypothetical protein